MPDTSIYGPPLPPPVPLPVEPEPDVGAKIGAAIDFVAETGKGAAQATLGPILGSDVVMNLVSDGVQTLTESDRTTAQRGQVGAELRGAVHGLALARVDHLRGQVAATREAYLGEGGRARRDALHSKIAQAKALTQDILTMRGMLANSALNRSVTQHVSEYITDKMGLPAVPGSLQERSRALEAKEHELAKMLHETPALGALGFAVWDDYTSDADLQVALREGFAEADAALDGVATDIRSGNLSLTELGPMVKAALRAKGWTRAKADAGDPQSRMAFEVLERDQHVEAAASAGLTVVGAALTATALLTTGPLGAAALVSAGIVNVGGAAYELAQASEVYGAASAGLAGSSGIADKDAAEARMAFAVADGLLAVADVGASAKVFRGIRVGRAGGAAAPATIRPTDPTDIIAVVDDAPGFSKRIRPTDPTNVVRVYEAPPRIDDAIGGARRADAPTIETLPARDTPTMEVRPASTRAPAPEVRAPKRRSAPKVESKAVAEPAPVAPEAVRSGTPGKARRAAVDDGIDADGWPRRDGGIESRGGEVVGPVDDFDFVGPPDPNSPFLREVARPRAVPEKLEVKLPENTLEMRFWAARWKKYDA